MTTNPMTSWDSSEDPCHDRGRSETWRDQRERRLDVAAADLAAVLQELEHRLPLMTYAPGSIRTFVVTTYLDSPDHRYLALAERTGGRLSIRVRVREYIALVEAEGQPARLAPSPICFLELKEQVGERRTKQRVELPKWRVTPVTRGDEVLHGDPQVVAALRGELDAGDLRPVMVGSYLRRAFGRDGGLRATFDEHVRFHRPPADLYETWSALTPDVLSEPAGRGPDRLLEIKQPRGIRSPPWLARLLERLQPARHQSKYRDGMRALAAAES